MHKYVLQAAENTKTHQKIKEFTVTYSKIPKDNQKKIYIFTCMYTKTNHAKNTTDAPNTSQYVFTYPYMT